MSRSTQEKVRELIEGEANMYGLELIDDRAFSNTGMWRVQGKSSLRDKVAIKYDFQQSYCSLIVKGADPDDGPCVVGGGYIDTDEKLATVVKRITKYIREHRR